MKYCVSGNRGFIGGHLINRLLADGHQVVAIDIKDGSDIRNLDSDYLVGVDTVFHLAALPRVPLSIEQPWETHDHNINGTLKVLLAARDAKVRRVVYSASSSAYGEQETLPLHEEMLPSPMSPYGVQKLVGEYYCKVFAQLYGLETVSLRYFNVYGEGMTVDSPYSSAIARFLEAKRLNQPLEVYGGEQTRDFTYVGDVVEANLLASKSSAVGKGEVINIGGGERYSIKEIAELISKNINYSPQRKGECMDTLADISNAQELLGWYPKQKLNDWLCALS